LEIQDFENEKKPQNKHRKLLIILLSSLGALVVGAAVCVVLLVGMVKADPGDSLMQPQVAAATPAPTETPSTALLEPEPAALQPDATPAPTETPGDIEYSGKKYVKNENVVNLLLLGIDTNTERRINKDGYRSDMVMVCAIDTAQNKATLLSIPRDTYTTIYKIDKETGEIEETFQDKINAAYAYGGGATKYSYPNAMACVQLFLERKNELEQPLGFTLDIPVYLYAGIDMDGIPPIASAVDGVEITLERGISGVGYKGQTVTLKYNNAINYVRARHGAGGDLDRARRQQKFMVALANKIKDRGREDIVGTILALYDDVQRYLFTNLSTDQMLDLGKILMKTDIDSIEMITVPAEQVHQNSKYIMVHDEAAMLDILLDIYYQEVE